ncbi:hypothetical protein D3C79_1037210 [compost metagenome]
MSIASIQAGDATSLRLDISNRYWPWAWIAASLIISARSADSLANNRTREPSPCTVARPAEIGSALAASQTTITS